MRLIHVIARGLGTTAAASLVLGAALAAGACASQAMRENEQLARERADAVLVSAADPVPYAIQPGDELALKFFFNPELDSQIVVLPDGTVDLALVGEVPVAGKSVGDVSTGLEQRYAEYLRFPEVTINVHKFASMVAYVGGEVRQPGVVQLASNMTALQGVISAGGFLSTGDVRKIVIIRDQGSETPLVMMMDLGEGFEMRAQHRDMVLRPRDIVIVPKTGIAQANQFIREYVRDLLPIQSSFNLQYQWTNLLNSSF